MNNLTKGKAIFYLLAIFIAGAAAGSVIGFNYGKQRSFGPPKPSEMAQHILSRFQSKLDLTPDQVGKIRPLVEQATSEMESIHRESWSRVSENLKRLNSQVSEHLTPDQKLKLEKLDEERREFIRNKCSPRPNGDSSTSRDNLKEP